MEPRGYQKADNATVGAFRTRVYQLNSERFAFFIPSLDARYGPDVNASCGYAYGPDQRPKCVL